MEVSQQDEREVPKCIISYGFMTDLDYLIGFVSIYYIRR